MTAETDLLPCPFCGEGEHLLVEHLEGTILHPAHRIRCDNCGASTGYTDRDFRADWNARACVSSATEALRAEVEVLRISSFANASVHIGIERDRQKARAERLAEALREAEKSLRTIADGAGRAEFLKYAGDVRGYANSRANAARAALEQETTK